MESYNVPSECEAKGVVCHRCTNLAKVAFEQIFQEERPSVSAIRRRSLAENARLAALIEKPGIDALRCDVRQDMATYAGYKTGLNVAKTVK